MMRSALIVGSVSTLVAMELATPPRTASAVHESPVAQTFAGLGDSFDTLTEADRLEPHRYAQGEAPTLPVSSDLPTFSVGLAHATSQEPRKGPSRHSYSTRKQRVAVVPVKSRPKSRISAKDSKSDRLEGVVVVHKPCRQNALDGLLKLLSLSRGCEI
jgi:hypothetical protein